MAESFYADLVIRNGNIITMANSKPRAQAVAVKFDRVLAIGRDDELGSLIGPDTQIINAGGKTIIPGLNDAHCHGMSAARQSIQVDCSPGAVSSINAIKESVSARCQKTPADQWVCGCLYDDTKLTEKRLLTRADLDEAAPNHAVWVQHVSGHIGMVNSRALKAANLTRSSPDPVGGRYGRDPATGELSGAVYEAAMDQFTRGSRPLIPPPTPEQDREAIRLMCSRAASLGITSFTEAITDPRTFQAFESARLAGELKVRVYMLFDVAYLDELIKTGIRTGFGDERLKFGAIKIIGDGAIAGRTAYLSEPYVGSQNDYGILATPPEILNEQVMTAHRAGFQIGIHANGDKAISLALDAYEKALRTYPREDHRHRIEHCTVVNPELLRRIRSLGIVTLPFGSYIYYHGEKMHFYGEKRLAMMFPHRSFLDAGIPVGGSSDYSCAPWPPLAGIQSCVTRKSQTGEELGTQQRITPEEALRIYTMGSAFSSFEENIKGSLEMGKLADLTIVDRDLLTIPPDEIVNTGVLMTIVGGEVIYRNPDW